MIEKETYPDTLTLEAESGREEKKDENEEEWVDPNPFDR